MTPELHYHLLDVFTDQIFGGNPLAVFPEPPPLETAIMQRIAAELNLSETVFVYPATTAAADHALRIFTPRVELPFAGHPTVGTAVLLAHLAGAPDSLTLRLEERAGIVNVTVSHRGHALYAELRVPEPPRRGVLEATRDDLAAMIGLTPADLASEPDGGCTVSAGVPFSVIPVASDAALTRARLDVSRWQSLLAASPAPHVYLVCHTGEHRLRVRMFSPAMGVAEDPATGAAAAALPAYLVHRFPLPAGEHTWTIAQGLELGRPSEIRLRFVMSAAGLTDVYVGGAAVRVGDGRLTPAIHPPA